MRPLDEQGKWQYKTETVSYTHLDVYKRQVYQNMMSFSRRDSMEQNKREQFIIRRIGGTTYKVRVVFNESGGETMEDKILRIVRNDMVTSDGTCGIMETPQMLSLIHISSL